ncbi:MAG: FG-GAP-like repeat-containing protein [Verrucomicrobia bacterium]|nr:FG-GAP-like repeat-containing protein [Verrucomicrobiota bacterium]
MADARGWQTFAEGRFTVLGPSGTGRTGFTELEPGPLGILFTNHLAPERYLTNQVLLNGAGVAAGDVDGDGWCDLYFCSLDGPNVLYRNLGNWRFVDITASAGVACPDQPSTGAALADLDGDGDLDLLVNGLGHGTRLFLNDGHGRFREATATAGLHAGTGAHSLALADVDGDGDLDVYVVNYRPTTFRDEPPKRYRVSLAGNQPELLAVDGRLVTEPDLVGRFTVDRVHGVLENGEADVLYRNEGGGRFTALSWTDGTFLDEDGQPASVPYDWGLSAMFYDLDGNGAPDLYVCNDFQSPDRIWLNDGHGKFRAISRLAIRQTSIFSMGLDIADIDRDGHPDLFVADMFSREHAKRQVQLMERQPVLVPVGVVENRPQYSRNTLLRNWGDTTFAEIAQLSGLEASDWTWCPVFLDVDLDGYEDLLAVTGHVRDAQNLDISRQIDALTRRPNLPWRDQLLLRRLFQPLLTPNFAFHNRGDLTFEEVGQNWGFHSRKVSQGIALADLDNDGDLDVAINCLDNSPLLCRNNAPQPRLAVRLRGAGANTHGIGARITVRQPGLPPQAQEMISGGRYLSNDEALRVFATAGPTNPVTLEVAWRSGAFTRTTNARPNRLYEVHEPAPTRSSTEPRPPPPAAPSQTFFADVSALLRHQHQDEPFDDFGRQPLLPHRLSQLGPGVSWFDYDGDGWDDLLVGGGRSGALAVLRNQQAAGFVPLEEPALATPLSRDQTTVLGLRLRSNQAALIVGTANYEDGSLRDAAVQAYLPGATAPADLVPASPDSPGPLAFADVDGDGDLDLFVGGRVRAGRYPEPANSRLYRHHEGRWVLDATNAPVLASAGLVSSALFTDLDNDGFPELVLALDAGPLRVFRNERGRLREWVPALQPRSDDRGALAGFRSLDRLTGWWNSVTAGDFDGDGRLDLLAGNWGRNTRHQSHLAQPLRLFAGDLDGDGSWEVVEAYHAVELGCLVPLRDYETLAASLPFLRNQYRNFTEFSTASLTEVLGSHLQDLHEIPLRTLDSLVFLNRGDHFALGALPREAQFAPIFGVAVADFDHDGCEDAVVAQNFFGVAPMTSRHDAGLGFWLRGDGRGGFEAVSPSASGIRVYGEGRGLAVGDFDQDGRTDIAVGQNAQATRLFRNVGAKPGLRVRLEGPPGNPTAIGASIRLAAADGTRGPAREVRAGGGYWSQDSSVTILPREPVPRAILVRWPGGQETEAVLPPNAASLVVTPRGVRAHE